MDKSKKMNQNIIKKIFLSLIFTTFFVSCKWGSTRPESSPRIPLKTSKTHILKKQRVSNNDTIEEKKDINIKNINSDNDLSFVIDSLPKTNQFVIKNNEVQQGQTLSNILLPIKGVPYSIILKILAEEISGVDFNSINVGQKYQLVLNPLTTL